MYLLKQVLLLDDMYLNHDFQSEVIGFSKNDQHRLINLKILALDEILPSRLAENNAVVSFRGVCYGGDNLCCSKSLSNIAFSG